MFSNIVADDYVPARVHVSFFWVRVLRGLVLVYTLGYAYASSGLWIQVRCVFSGVRDSSRWLCLVGGVGVVVDMDGATVLSAMDSAAGMCRGLSAAQILLCSNGFAAVSFV